jgi:hypothetical protein
MKTIERETTTMRLMTLIVRLVEAFPMWHRNISCREGRFALALFMTKSGAVDCLERIEKILGDVENYDRLNASGRSDLKRRAGSERREIDDIVSFIKRLDREAKRED